MVKIKFIVQCTTETDISKSIITICLYTKSLRDPPAQNSCSMSTISLLSSIYAYRMESILTCTIYKSRKFSPPVGSIFPPTPIKSTIAGFLIFLISSVSFRKSLTSSGFSNSSGLRVLTATRQPFSSSPRLTNANAPSPSWHFTFIWLASMILSLGSISRNVLKPYKHRVPVSISDSTRSITKKNPSQETILTNLFFNLPEKPGLISQQRLLSSKMQQREPPLRPSQPDRRRCP